MVGGFTSATPVLHVDGSTYIGTITTAGNIAVGQYNESTKAWTLSPDIATGFADWHDAPGILVRSSDKKILISYSGHGGPKCFTALSTNAEDVSSWGAPVDITASIGTSSFTYPTLCQLSGESGTIYLFWRDDPSGTAQWYYSTSTDGGATWAAGKIFWQCAAGKQGYVFWDSDNTARIDFIAGDDSANFGNGAVNVYHFYYSAGNFYKSDGTLIGATSSTAVTPATATKIYDGATNGSFLQPSGVVTNGATPRCGLLALNAADNSNPSAPTHPINFWYAVYSGGTWNVNLISADGAPASFSPPGLGNVAPDPNDATTVYVNKFKGQVWKYVTPDGGATWSSTQITNDSYNVNSYIEPVRGSSPPLKAIWLYGPQAPSYEIFPQFWTVRGYPAR